MHPKGIDFFLVGEPLAGGEDRRRGRQERVTAGRLTSSPLKGGCCYGKRHKVQAPKTNTVMRLVGRESGPVKSSRVMHLWPPVILDGGKTQRP
uniref:Uncharacterized protein n=1 Tax=Gasterosteus aculeatus TaxID=69293 RepID=G3NCC5_GASAC